ncbi:MAG TPA: dTDP-4-dehydrorhamnose 3,5-epimerase [Acetobacteraceae bacterium]|jgi:dTDP-4-dehydrorhamnose 3,5-epimerase
MRFEELKLAGAFVVAPERHRDARGWFARTFCRDEFAAHGLIVDFAQCSASFNARRGTLRGLHFQRAPHAETKLVRCTRGAVQDVLLDLRPGSTTFRCWHAVELSEANGVAVYIPAGVAHGFQALTDGSEVFYQIAERHVPESSAGVRWDDPAFSIDWPIRSPILSQRDASYADFCKAAAHE